MAQKQPTAPELTSEQKELQTRVQLFDKEFQTIQNKYRLRAVAQVVLPGGAVLTVPIQVFPFGPAQPQAEAEAEKASDIDN